MREIEVKTSKEFEIVDITHSIEEIVKESGVKEGIAVIFTKHTTTSLIINENEPRLLRDIERLFKGLVPKEGRYAHNSIDRNAHSHLRAILMNPSLTVPIEDGKLFLGTWQSILFIELDGPRIRKVLVKICEC
ncbi:YjbQ family protein [Thermococci archaeon]|uniref:secondary thiamine-phosphate synthase enzyme YjbQ n=1 Tax=Palaeococcus sp. (in: euryarchaeotes) TaxID=2820298 RepID=UPI000F28B3CA|nr:secondary thiamine-phosphate synthase enzyme YjbQ [Palaeococcus sp. (in: euryarchaeotes)]MCD6559586.1 YjbQ family protein [Palaeococcus sp. (in: euryarchaeotes)]RLF89389.1 MAG: YjbQ family protein [Thermococci archaeon]